MRHCLRRVAPWGLLAFALSGCANLAPAPMADQATASQTAALDRPSSALPAARTVLTPIAPAPIAMAPTPPSRITGTVRAPNGIVAAGAYNAQASAMGAIIAAGAGNIIAAGAGNWQGRSRQLLAADGEGLAERPLAGVTVRLTDALFAPLPGVAATTTDATGAYAFPPLYPGSIALVVAEIRTADGRPATLVGVVQSAQAATGDIDLPSTLVSRAWLASDERSLSTLDPATYRATVTAVGHALAGRPLPDLASPKSLVDSVEALRGTHAGLRASLPTMISSTAASAGPDSSPPTVKAKPAHDHASHGADSLQPEPVASLPIARDEGTAGPVAVLPIPTPGVITPEASASASGDAKPAAAAALVPTAPSPTVDLSTGPVSHGPHGK